MPRLGPIVQEKPYRRPGARRQLITAIAVVTGLAVVLVAAYFFFLPRKQTYVLETWDEAVVQRGELEETFDGIGTLAMETTEDLLSPQSGVLEEVLVAPGKTVAAGAPIARIRSDALEQSLDEALAALAAAQRDLEELLALRALDAAVYERRHAGHELAVAAAEEFLKTRRTLLSTDGATQAEVKRAEADVQAARNALADAEVDQQISETRSSFQREDVQSEIDRYATRVAALESERAACTIRSPLTGTVTRVYSERGRFVPQYSTVITVVDFSRPQVNLTVPATAIGKIAPMLPASVLLGETWRAAHVSEVGLEALGGSSTQAPAVQVVIVFDDPSSTVFPGAPVGVRISLGTKYDALWLPRAPFLTSGSQLTVFRVQGDTAVRMEAYFGIVTDQKVEVLSGLAEGDVVVTSSYQDFLQYPEITLAKGGGRR